MVAFRDVDLKRSFTGGSASRASHARRAIVMTARAAPHSPKDGECAGASPRAPRQRAHPLAGRMAQNEPAVAEEIDVDNLNVRLIGADIVAVSKGSADVAIALGVVNGPHANARFVGLVRNAEQPELAHQLRAEELADEDFIAIIRPDVAQYRPVRCRRSPGTTRDPRRRGGRPVRYPASSQSRAHRD